MKKTRFIRLFSVIVLLLGIMMTNCKEDEISNTGTLSVSFVNHPSDITVNIYSIDNTNVPIDYFQLDNSGKAQRDLNIGNYYVRVTSATYFSPIGFQIKPNNTTAILWNFKNGSQIQ